MSLAAHSWSHMGPRRGDSSRRAGADAGTPNMPPSFPLPSGPPPSLPLPSGPPPSLPLPQHGTSPRLGLHGPRSGLHDNPPMAPMGQANQGQYANLPMPQSGEYGHAYANFANGGISYGNVRPLPLPQQAPVQHGTSPGLGLYGIPPMAPMGRPNQGQYANLPMPQSGEHGHAYANFGNGGIPYSNDRPPKTTTWLGGVGWPPLPMAPPSAPPAPPPPPAVSQSESPAPYMLDESQRFDHLVLLAPPSASNTYTHMRACMHIRALHATHMHCTPHTHACRCCGRSSFRPTRRAEVVAG